MTSNARLADLARVHAERHPPRTAGRRAAAALYIALADTKTPDAARRALGTFGTPQTQADATALLRELQTEARARMNSGSFIGRHGLVQYTERLGRTYPREGPCELGLCREMRVREREAFDAARRQLAELEHRAPFDAKTIRLRNALPSWQASLDQGPRAGRGNSLVFDHCHRHGWVRGLICMGCNNGLALFEPEPRSEWAAQASGTLLDLITAYRANCPDCRAADETGEL